MKRFRAGFVKNQFVMELISTSEQRSCGVSFALLNLICVRSSKKWKG